MLLGRIDAARANELLSTLQDMMQFAAKHPQFLSMRFTETCQSVLLLAYPWHGQLHDTYARYGKWPEVLWLPAGFNVRAIPNVIVPTAMKSVFFLTPDTRKVRLLFEVTNQSARYHTTELTIDLLEAAAGVKLTPAFPSSPNPTKDS